jgi:hypothetical protein
VAEGGCDILDAVPRSRYGPFAALAVAAIAAAIGAQAACSDGNPNRPGDTGDPQGPNTLTAAERAAGWRLLFDGRTTAGWRGFKQAGMPAGWQVVDGALTRVSGGGDIITTEQFANFELALEWQIAAGGNSGIMFRVSEAADATFQTGPEMQVLDNAAHPDGANPLSSAGACYGLYPPVSNVTRPVGSCSAPTGSQGGKRARTATPHATAASRPATSPSRTMGTESRIEISR